MSGVDQPSGSINDRFVRFHLAAIIDSAEDAIISKNLDGIVQSWNPGAERMFGFTSAEMIGQPILRLLPKGNEDEEVTILTRLRAGEHICNFKTQRCHKDGRLIPVSLTISPVRDGGGRIIGASKIARDITAERDQMIAQNALIERLQKALYEIKTLRGLLPVCMHCKKIRDDQGFWQQMEAYFHMHSNVEFSHGLCPECVEIHYQKVD
ncbi:MAG: PAS domain S-box protein [Verrucomicrobia bacterium]|nr:PAS domain S-box protein [Verrucomicrobiota bacterium]